MMFGNEDDFDYVIEDLAIMLFDIEKIDVKMKDLKEEEFCNNTDISDVILHRFEEECELVLQIHKRDPVILETHGIILSLSKIRSARNDNAHVYNRKGLDEWWKIITFLHPKIREFAFDLEMAANNPVFKTSSNDAAIIKSASHAAKEDVHAKSSFASVIEAPEQPSATHPPGQGTFDLAFSKAEQNKSDPMKKSTDQGVDR